MNLVSIRIITGDAARLADCCEKATGAHEGRRKEGMNITDAMADRDLQTLRAAIAGQVFVRGEAGHDRDRQGWNLAMDTRPALVVAAGSAADAAQAVRYARARGMRITPQGTGHGAGPAVTGGSS